ncbi:uncharacterized protein A4U43_C07F15890 [Asparagus officinalis]|uniref:U-box domain-containing protein n=1 Tax=Asparagus officinalis TaxID=4686 RepID=A0A5P1ECJ9_ASPOF|nr:U-box domain-containing protein 44-like [Asparagus officinalis]ONK63503.1 uncharacterized protein A4U43_C07F15890 [Asparagus officinalis]
MPESLPYLLSGIISSIDETLSVSSSSSFSETLNLALPPFASFIERMKPIIQELHQNADPDIVSIKRAVESLHSQLRRTQVLIKNCNGPPISAKSMENCVHDLGRCLGLLLMAWIDAPCEIREGMGMLQKEMMATRFEEEMEIAEDDGVVRDIEDLMVRVKRGGEEVDTMMAYLELGVLIRKGLVDEEENGRVISVLLNRLGCGKNGERLKIILLLRSLACQNDENKEKMAGIETLSTIVRSLTRDIEESREAVGLLRDLSVTQKVRQRIGRVQGCIVMLVTLFNGDDCRASHDAGMILMALSSNTQNVLLMAEAGYFIPLVQYLKEGSHMNKIIMATAISRMELTDQMRSILGELGCIEPLVKMFTSGKLEAKMSSLGAILNLSSLIQNVRFLIDAGIVPPLLQLLFSVTSVLLTLREPASAILASLAKSELILIHKDAAHQILSLLNLSSPIIQLHLLNALNSIASHSKSKRVRAKMNENGAIQLLFPFLIESSPELRTVALNLLFNLSEDFTEELTDFLGENHLNILVDIIRTTVSENEKAAALAILSNLLINEKKATEILIKANLIPLLVSLIETNSTIAPTTTRTWLIESIAGVLIRFTVPWDKKLQKISASHGVIPCLVKLLSDGSAIAKSRAASSLAQLSQNSLSLCKNKSSRWFCVINSSESFCELHNGHCIIKNTFCIVKAGAVSPLIRILEGKEREADEAVLNALSTLMQDEIWENGSKLIENSSGVQTIIRILDIGSLKAQEKAVWMLERIFRSDSYREKHGARAQLLLIDLAQKGDPSLKPMIAKILAHLDLLQMQSSYF